VPALMLGCLACAATVLAADEEGWVTLFDGKTLRGWKQVSGTAFFEVIDGAIVGTTRLNSLNSFLATDETYRDFVLEFEVKQDGGPANSGVQIRSATDPSYNEGRVFGYQVEIDPFERAWSGGIYDEQRRGWLYPLTLNPSARGVYRPQEWNRFRIEAIGTTIHTWVNDVPVAHVIDAVSSEGFIALQIHSIERADEVDRRTLWRNIRLRETTAATPPVETLFVRNLIPNDLSDIERRQGWRLLFDGRTTDGWRGVDGASFPTRRWKVENGELVLLSGGKGEHIVTEDQYAAFELQLEFKLSPGADSGIVYFVPDRSVTPTSPFLGLEYQLRDDAVDPDLARGVITSNTLGSLFGVLPRKQLMPNLGLAPRVGEWQHARIVAHFDSRVEHWLNGVKVLEYVRGSPAYRKAVAASPLHALIDFGENARGRIVLQDGGREVRFRSVKIRAL